MKTKMFVVAISPYFGRREYRIAKLTKRQLVTEPLNETGAQMRFYRPAVEGLKDGMPLTLFPKRRYDANEYFLKLEHGD